MPTGYTLGALDIAGLIAFLGVVVLITVRSAARAKSTQAYFLASRSAPG